MNNSRLLVHIEKGKCLDVNQYDEFPSRNILPDGLYAAHSSLIIDALHVRDEQIGYIILNAGDHPGMIYESLRHQFSTAIKGTQMVNTINRYSEGLEEIVEERTKMLTSLNEEMKKEIKKGKLPKMNCSSRKTWSPWAFLPEALPMNFNNILTALTGNVSLLIEDEGTYEYRRDVYNTLINAIENARNLTGQLLTFSKGGFPIKKSHAYHSSY